jgi:putative peptidoglycan lipid II flippase
MSEPTATLSPPSPRPPAPKSFLQHAKLIGVLTLISRFFGLGRDIVAAHYLGAKLVGSAFAFAFLVPNLFRKLFGEGALSAAFIPLYAQAIKKDHTDADANPDAPSTANDFAASAVNLLVLILLALTVVGEGITFALMHLGSPSYDRLLALKLTAIMLPYVVLICGGAFLSAILQVHKRFGPPAAVPIILNVCHILVLLIGARIVGLNRATPPGLVEPKQITLSYWLAVVVLIAGVLQVSVLLPALRQVGFTFKFALGVWSPAIRRMLLLSLPVAMGAGVLQLSVFLDKAISYALMVHVDVQQHPIASLKFFGQMVRLPMELGALRRLDVAQLMYQFPLGIFAIALATAIFPSLSAESLEKDRKQFCGLLRHGIEASLWEGLPASVGLIMVAEPAVRLLFQHGQITEHDASLIARSTMVYAAAIWAFSLLQIINRAYYALHDTRTPLVMSVVNILINLVVEIPLLWKMGESGMAVGTVVSFAFQALLMLWLLDRKIGGLDLHRSLMPTFKMLLATAVMGVACYDLKYSPLYPHFDTRLGWALRLLVLLLVGAIAYLGSCWLLGVTMLQELLPKRKKQ